METLPQSKFKVEHIPPEPEPEPEPSLPVFDEDNESEWDPFGDIGDSAIVSCYNLLLFSSLPSFLIFPFYRTIPSSILLFPYNQLRFTDL